MHIPVLKKEVIEYLNPKPNENFIDCTVGEGGHTAAILKENKPEGRVLGIEADTEIYQNLKRRVAEFSKRLILINDSYTSLKAIVEKYNFGPVGGILFDLGMSSWHLEESKRGFSFLRDEPLDMRYEIKSQKYLTAERIVNEYSEEEIGKILKEYGEERFARRISKEIVKARKIRPIKTTFDLTGIINRAIPRGYHSRKINPATRTFQALRIAVNDELENLKEGLSQSLEVLEAGGRLIVISFHSLEDRIVKRFFKENSSTISPQDSSSLEILTKKPITPSEIETKINPRSRSAKLRAAIKV